MNEQRAEIRPLNGLRGIAALSVAAGHYQLGNLVPAFAGLNWWKDPAVDLFFCLSGFTMCLAYRAGEADRLAFRDFLVARIARLYPLYLLSLVVCAYIAHQLPVLTERQYQARLWDFVRLMTMTNAWSVISSGSHWNPPAWSVSVEFFCYLFIFPPLFYLIRWLTRRRWLVRLILSTLLVTGSCYVFVNYFNWTVFLCGRDPRCGVPEFAFSVNLIRGILGFTAGWAVYASFLVRDRLSVWASRHADAISLAVLALMAAGILRLVPIEVTLIGCPLLILGVSSGRSLAGRFLSWRPVRYLGNISYSIYLIHVPWLDFGRVRAGLFGSHPTDTVSGTILLVGGMLALSALSYHAVEMPLRRLIRAAWLVRDSGTGSSRAKSGARAFAATAAVLAIAAAARTGVFHPVPPLAVEPGQEIAANPTFGLVEGHGWSVMESWGIWSVGRRSTLDLSVAPAPPAHLELLVKGSFYLNDRHPTLTARVMANGIEIGVIKPTAADKAIETELPLPSAALPAEGGSLRIDLLIDSPASPKSLGLSNDTRDLGFGLQSMKLMAD